MFVLHTHGGLIGHAYIVMQGIGWHSTIYMHDSHIYYTTYYALCCLLSNLNDGNAEVTKIGRSSELFQEVKKKK